MRSNWKREPGAADASSETMLVSLDPPYDGMLANWQGLEDSTHGLRQRSR